MKKKKPPQSPPDGRGKRPTDPNQFAAWLIEQTTGTSEDCTKNSQPQERRKKRK